MFIVKNTSESWDSYYKVSNLPLLCPVEHSDLSFYVQAAIGFAELQFFESRST